MIVSIGLEPAAVVGPSILDEPKQIERLVSQRVMAFLKDPAAVTKAFDEEAVEPEHQHGLLMAAADLANAWPRLAPLDARALVKKLVHKVVVGRQEIEIILPRQERRSALLRDQVRGESKDQDPYNPGGDHLRLHVEARFKRCNGEMRLIIPGKPQTNEAARPNPRLLSSRSPMGALARRAPIGEMAEGGELASNLLHRDNEAVMKVCHDYRWAREAG